MSARSSRSVRAKTRLADPAVAASAVGPLLTPPTTAASGELEQLRSGLEHTQRLATLGTLAGLIAHEFNNILTPVMSYAQLALDKPQDRALARKALERAADGSERAARIATAILNFAREDEHRSTGNIEPGEGRLAGQGAGLDSSAQALNGGSWIGKPPTFASVDPSESERASVSSAIQESLACLARDPAKDGIALRLEAPSGLVAKMRPVALQQVVLNMVLNARRAMNPGGGELTIRGASLSERPDPPRGAVCSSGNLATPARRATDPKHWIQLEIIDTGCGMPPELLTRIFEPFVSQDRRLSGSGGTRAVGEERGSGLGLTLCRRLVEQVGGSVWVTSTPGAGSCFTLLLPAA